MSEASTTEKINILLLKRQTIDASLVSLKEQRQTIDFELRQLQAQLHSEEQENDSDV